MSSSSNSTKSAELVPQVAASTTSLTAALRAASGAPAAWREQRRGSFLVMVVGTLALLAVVMLVYVSVGNQDTATKAALSKRERLDDVPQQFADYLSVRIIGADVMSTYYDNSSITTRRAGVPTGEPVLLREAFDYGYTDWLRRSDTLDRAEAFNPVGSYVRLPQTTPVVMPTAEDPDPIYTGGLPGRWIPSDPWLASNEPTWLGFVSGRGNDMTTGPLEAASYEPAVLKKDWLHISNVAPDGRFVNLYNLAPFQSGRRIGNFGAMPGLGNFIGPFGSLPRLSEGLSLLRGSENYDDADTSGNLTAWNFAVGGGDRAVPAYWDSWQRGAFRLAEDNRVGGTYGPGTPNYLPYQWADADGDGMFDARWMELTDSRLFDLTSDPSRIVNLLETDGKFRYFFAVRIIDASGMVNVNIATDQAAAPDATHPAGISPSDIDLRRLLTLHDVYDGYRSKPTEFAVQLGRPRAGYDAIKNPVNDPSALRADNYGPANGIFPNLTCPPVPEAGYDAIRAYTVGSQAYTSLRLSLASGSFTPLASSVDSSVEYRGTNLHTEFARDAFFRNTAASSGIALGNRDTRDLIARRLWDFVPGQGQFPVVFASEADYFNVGVSSKPLDQHAPPDFTPVVADGEGRYPTLAARRAEYYATKSAAILSTQTSLFSDSSGNTLTQFESSGTFGIDDLAELLTYRASNDIDVLSNLERVLSGRDKLPYAPGAVVPANQPDPRKFDPLRSNRGPDLELVRDTARGNRDQTANPDGRADVAARLQLDSDVRQRLTTVSGARALHTRRDVDFDKIETTELKTSARELLEDFVRYPDEPVALLSMNSIFGTYCNALLPFSNIAETWDSSSANFGRYKTLSYGYRGSELAIYTAAHMAANMADLADADNTPGIWTLLLSNGYRTTVNTNVAFEAWQDNRRLDLDESQGVTGAATRLATAATAGTLAAPAANIYGMEPQPFVTAVATFTVYTDRPEEAGGDEDGWDPNEVPPTPKAVKIRPDVTETNTDLLYRVVAFRLHNPFSVDITLGDPREIFTKRTSDSASIQVAGQAENIDLGDAPTMTLDRQKDFYYIKFGGRTFMLTALEDRPVSDPYGPTPVAGGLDVTAKRLTVKAGASAVCYALSQLPRTIMTENIQGAQTATVDPPLDPSVPADFTPSAMKRLIEEQLGRGGTGTNPDDAYFWIPEIDPSASGPTAGAVGGLNQTPPAAGSPPVPNGQGNFQAWVDSSGTIDLGAFGQLLEHNLSGDAIKKEFAAPDGSPEEQALLANTRVELWRSVRTGDPAATNNTAAGELWDREGITLPSSQWDGTGSLPSTSARAYVRNDYKNDQLVDRFRVPLDPGSDSFIDLDARFKVPLSEMEVAIDVEGSAEETDRYEWQRGLTFVMWAAARRPQDPIVAAGGQPPVGSLPGFCLESKNPGSYLASPPVESWNTYSYQDPSSGISWVNTDLDVRFFENNATVGYAGAKTLKEWRDSATSRTFCPMIARSSTQVADAPNSFEVSTGDRVMPQNQTTRDFAIPYSDQYAQLVVSSAPKAVASPAGLADGATEFQSTFFTRLHGAPVTATSAKEEKLGSTLRVGDMLLPMGIGPVHAPVDSTGAAVTNTDLSWTTFGEALTIALGYDIPVNDLTAADLLTLEESAEGLKWMVGPGRLLRPQSIGVQAGTTPPRTEWRAAFDRGNLVLDDFVPFFNTNATGADDPGIFEPARNDQRMFTQVPLALNVLDMFSASVAGEESITRAVPGLVNLNTAPLAVARALPMLSPLSRSTSSEVVALNITGTPDQTFTFRVNGSSIPSSPAIKVGASPAVIQAALEAFPEIGKGNVHVTAGDPLDPGTGWPASIAPYLGADYIISYTGERSTEDIVENFITCTLGTFTTVSDGSDVRIGPGWWGEGAGIDQTTDLAATLVANRDKVEVPLRPQSWYQYDPTGYNFPVQSIRYIARDFTNSPAAPDTNVERLVSRGYESGISAVSETPGFQSLGALMTLRYRGREFAGTGGAPYRFEAATRSSIDYMGHSRTQRDPLLPPPSLIRMAQPLTGFANGNQSVIGVDSVLTGEQLPVPGVPLPTNIDKLVGTDTMADEFKEKLAVANAVVNTASTRSDYFIAWFVVHGYQQSDVDQLGADDVLTPSIARRFMMVVDRSKVVKTGDKPEVLLFKEVPYKGR